MSSDWKCELARASFFYSGPVAAIEPDELWKLVEAKEPERDESLRAENIRTLSLTLADGAQLLTLNLQPGRIDWMLTTSMGKYVDVAPKVIPEFSQRVAGGMAKSAREFSRLALGLVLQMPVENRKSGYDTLLQLVPSLRVEYSEDLSDLMLQLNRRHNSSVSNSLRINRHMKWSVMRFTTLGFLASGSGGIVTHADSDQHTCRLELDINTAPEPPTLFKGDLVVNIFNEFMSDALETMSKGERI